MTLRDELEDILRPMKEERDGEACDYVVFFSEDGYEENVEHVVCFREQVEQVKAYAEQADPPFLSIHTFSKPFYNYVGNTPD